MRRLSVRAASACEHATSKRCRCRCGGELHGAARTEDVCDLPTADPHAPYPYQQLALALDTRPLVERAL